LSSLAAVAGYFLLRPPLRVFIVPQNSEHNPQIRQLLLDNYSSKINRIVILGTNHQDVGPLLIDCQSSGYDLLVAREHSFVNTKKVAKSVYPQADIHGFIFRPRHHYPSLINDVNRLISPLNDRQTLFLVSVDFAHYLNQSQSRDNDISTLNLLRQQDYSRLSSLTSTHTDCPDCLIAILHLFGSRRLEVIDWFYRSGTSYYFISL